MMHHKSPLAEPYIEKAPKVELKALQPHLTYVFLGKGYSLPVIIASGLNLHQVESLVEV